MIAWSCLTCEYAAMYIEAVPNHKWPPAIAGKPVHPVYLSKLIHGTKGDVAGRLLQVIAALWAELPDDAEMRLLAED